jgi:O-antigen ligase
VSEGGVRKIGLAFAQACLLAIVALVPLIILPSWSDPLQLPKLQAMEILEGACLAGLLVGLSPAGLWRRWRASPIFWPAVAYLVWVGISTATSIDPSNSFWGITGRWGGAPTLLAYVLLAFLVITALESPRQLLVAAMAALGAACLVSLYGLAQYVGWDFVSWNVDWVQSAFSTMGNPDFLANYELLYIFLAAGLYLLGRPRRGAWLLLVASALCTAAMWATQTRSAWLVFVAAAVVLGWWVHRGGAGDPAARSRMRRLAVVWVVATAVVLAWQPSIRARIVSVAVDAARAAGYALNISQPTPVGSAGNSMAERIWIWRGVVPMIAAKPWTGWGPDTMYEAFPRYQAPGKAKVFPPNIVIDRAHNDYLQVAVDSGLPALAAYAWLLLAALAAGVRAWRGATDPRVRALLLGCLAGGLAYWIELGVNIAMPASAPHAWFWLGALLAVAAASEGAVAAAPVAPQQDEEQGPGDGEQRPEQPADGDA